MDTGESHETPLLTLAHLVHDETSFVAAEDGHTWQGQTGHAQWSSEPTGPARATLDMLLHAARAGPVGSEDRALPCCNGGDYGHRCIARDAIAHTRTSRPR